MKRVVKFVGNGVLPLTFYKKGQDVKFVILAQNDTAELNDEEFEKVRNLVSKGLLQIVQNKYDVEVVLAGLADVYDETDKVATINHSIGHTLYEVVVMDDNYEVVNKTATSFDIKLKTGGTSAGADVGYAVLVEKQ